MMSNDHLDRETLVMLQDVMEDQFPALIETFLADAQERIRQLQHALAAQDADTVRRQAHSFKGSCHNIGALRLAALCETVESCGRDGELAGLEQQLAAIDDELSYLQPTLSGFVN